MNLKGVKFAEANHRKEDEETGMPNGVRHQMMEACRYSGQIFESFLIIIMTDDLQMNYLKHKM